MGFWDKMVELRVINGGDGGYRVARDDRANNNQKFLVHVLMVFWDEKGIQWWRWGFQGSGRFEEIKIKKFLSYNCGYNKLNLTEKI